MALVSQELLHDSRALTAEELASLPHASAMNLRDVLAMLVSPDNGRPLTSVEGGLSDGERIYPIIEDAPVLYPAAVADILTDTAVQPIQADPLQQYFALSRIRQTGEINAPHTSIHAQRHYFRMRDFMSNLTGTVLDVGCDDVALSKALYPPACNFIGLDPFAQADDFRVIGVGERLPFKSGSLDNVVFNTSLDHILDYYCALEEAKRVLRPEGTLIIASLVWVGNTSLLPDAVHFHHFRQSELFGALGDLSMTAVDSLAYSYKGNSFRFGLYLRAKR